MELNEPSRKTRGRGASYNPVNRFDRMEIHPDPDFDKGDQPPLKTEFFRDTTKKIVNFNESPDIGFSASVNPYRGCEHGCIYCFARPMHEYFGLSAGLDFETKIFVKEDAAALLRREFGKASWEPQPVIVGAATDPYQPIEKKLRITRAVLDVFREFRNPMGLITKNELVTRDLDILKELAATDCCAVNISITTLDRHLARVMEPRTSQPENRLRAVAALSREGIPVNVMIAPVIPGLNDHEIPRIVEAASNAGAASAAYVVLRLPYALKELFERWLEQHFPERKFSVLRKLCALHGGKLYDPHFHKRMSGEGFLADQIGQLFAVSCRKHALQKRPRSHLSTRHFRPAGGRQLQLF